MHVELKSVNKQITNEMQIINVQSEVGHNVDQQHKMVFIKKHIQKKRIEVKKTQTIIEHLQQELHTLEEKLKAHHRSERASASRTRYS